MSKVTMKAWTLEEKRELRHKFVREYLHSFLASETVSSLNNEESDNFDYLLNQFNMYSFTKEARKIAYRDCRLFLNLFSDYSFVEKNLDEVVTIFYNCRGGFICPDDIQEIYDIPDDKMKKYKKLTRIANSFKPIFICWDININEFISFTLNSSSDSPRILTINYNPILASKKNFIQKIKEANKIKRV